MNERPRRRSVFREIGLDNPGPAPTRNILAKERPQSVRFRSRDDAHVVDRNEDVDVVGASAVNDEPQATPAPTAPRLLSSRPAMDRIGAILLLFAVALPLLRDAPWLGQSATLPLQPVEGGVIPRDASTRTGPILSTRSDSPTDVCFRWAQQSAIVNGTLYLYGGEASTSADQTENTWNNDFLTLDLTTAWQIASPSLTGLPQPSGPPAVALGYLWNSHDSLYLYGGEFSWKPVKSPTAFSLWEYDIISQSWTEHSDPTTSSGDSAPDHGVAVQRAAEGAGASVPSLGRGFYFGGHQDGYTTQGWSQSVPRIYLQSLLEFTYPGYTNDAVTALSNGKTAGTDGNYRNITEGGLQQSAGFTERADGLLVHVPGFGDQGILLALAGGTNETFTQMNEIDVYDIANSTWYKQSTSGSTPNMRVNPCAVAASAPDGSSTNIYMFGGQNLIPYDNQTEYNDMWILTLPSFTWIEVDQGNQSVPYGRSGHTCNIWDAQMVVVGGYVGDQLSCESPGIYVYDLSNVEWIQQFTARSSGTDDGSSGSGLDSTKTATASGSKSTASTNFNSTSANNPFNQQPAQIGDGSISGGLEGSYGYTVPQIVIDVIGGGPSGGATVTKPVVTATAGPLATGSAVTYTVTSADGSTATETPSASSGGTGSPSSGGSGGPNIAAIVVGVICGLLFLVACYLAFCLYVYRKQIQLYKRHAEMAQRQARGEKTPAVAGLLASDSSNKTSDERRRLADGTMRLSESASQNESYGGRSADQTSSSGRPDYGQMRRDSDGSSMDNLLVDHEPTFVGVMLNPRRSLRVINRD